MPPILVCIQHESYRQRQPSGVVVRLHPLLNRPRRIAVGYLMKFHDLPGISLSYPGVGSLRWQIVSRVLEAGVLALLVASLAAIQSAAAESSGEEESPQPIVIAAGAEWIPLRPALDIEPGSALDFSLRDRKSTRLNSSHVSE